MSGYEIARLLDCIERGDLLTVSCRSLQTAHNVIELLAEVKRLVVASMFHAIDSAFAPVPSETLFCVLDFDKATLPESVEDLEADRNVQRELFSILRRATGNHQPTWDEFNKRRFMEAGAEVGTGDTSGWRFCTDDGIATHIRSGIDPTRAPRARLCHHRNLVKLIGFYRLYHSYLEFLERQNVPLTVS